MMFTSYHVLPLVAFIGVVLFVLMLIILAPREALKVKE
jgi:hypothetical protein